jgi:purine-cytosine permease-like protein
VIKIHIDIFPAVAAIAGREHFSAILNNFLSILGYWVAFFLVVVAEEHFIFRRWIIPGGYDLTVS